jgi:acetyl/propionyl-CoA carboxylase alpha subunit
MTEREFQWRINGRDYRIQIDESAHPGTFHVEGRTIPFRVIAAHSNGGIIEMDGRTFVFYIHRDRNFHSVWVNGRTVRLERVGKQRSSDSAATVVGGEVVAPMPGKILRVEVRKGDAVSERQAVLTMESMKMENTLLAPAAGRVDDIRCSEGQVVDAGAVLLTIRASGTVPGVPESGHPGLSPHIIRNPDGDSPGMSPFGDILGQSHA